MKRMNRTKRNLLMALLCLVFALLLYGCGSDAAAPAPSAAPAPESSAVPSAALPDASLTPVEEAEDPFTVAQSFKDRPLEELIAVIGEPLSADYVSSCIGGPGAKDGELKYDGFTVYTLLDGDTETVQGVLAD